MLKDAAAHDVLGVAADADAASIKRAFRRLAMRWHPDRNSAPEALETFKRLRAAYVQMMGFQEEEEADDAPPEAEAASSSQSKARAADHFQDLELSIEEVFHGGEKSVWIESQASCEACDGSGVVELAHSRLCSCCHGSGPLRIGACCMRGLRWARLFQARHLSGVQWVWPARGAQDPVCAHSPRHAAG